MHEPTYQCRHQSAKMRQVDTRSFDVQQYATEAQLEKDAVGKYDTRMRGLIQDIVMEPTILEVKILV